MGQEVLKELLTGSGPIVILVFGFLLVYFFWDVIKKLSRAEGIEELTHERTEKVASNVHELRNILQKEIVHREVNDKAIKQLQEEVKNLNERIIRMDSFNNYKRQERGTHKN